MSDDKICVNFKDGLLQGFIFFESLSEAMGFIFGVQRRERFDPKGRYARIAW